MIQPLHPRRSTRLGLSWRKWPKRSRILWREFGLESLISIKFSPDGLSADTVRGRHAPRERGTILTYAFGRSAKPAASSSTEQVQEPSRTSMPAARSLCFSALPMKPQIS